MPDCCSSRPCSSWCPCAKDGKPCVPTSERPASCVRCYRFIGGTAPLPRSVLLYVAILRCAGPKVWVLCRPNPHWGYQCWPGEVLRWKRTRAEVMFWCGCVAEVRTVHFSRLTPREALRCP